MVDTTKRRGCDVCRKRHIKCGRELPSCTQCQRAGWTCPGYESHLAFVNYSQSFPTGRSKPATNRSREIRPAREPNSQANSLLDRNQQHDTGRLVRASRLQSQTPIPIAPATSSVDTIRKQFIWGFEQRSLPARFETQSIEPYLKFIPLYLGQSEALDNTVRFLSLASSLPQQQRNIQALSRPNKTLLNAYSSSVRALASAVGDPKEWNSSATLAATLIMQLYETWCSWDSPARIVHAGAVATLIQHRGPKLLNDTFSVAILEAEVANILFTALRDDKPCFLATRQWSDIITYAGRTANNGPGRYDIAQLILLSAWTYFPGVVVGFREFLQVVARSAGPGRQQQQRDTFQTSSRYTSPMPDDLSASAFGSTSTSSGHSPHSISSNSSHDSPTTFPTNFLNPSSYPDTGSIPRSSHDSPDIDVTTTPAYHTGYIPPSLSSTPPSSYQPISTTFAPLTLSLRALRQRALLWRSAHLPIDPVRIERDVKPTGGLFIYELISEVGSATLIAMCCYMLASVAPFTDPDHGIREIQVCERGAAEVMQVVRKYWLENPGHAFFAAGHARNSLKLAWLKTRDMDGVKGGGVDGKGGVLGVTDASERIAELINSVYAC